MKIKGWKKFQHYKHRDPPWIRLYRGLLNDREWHNLSGEAAKSLVMLWLIASERDGDLPPAADLAFRLRLTEDQTNQVLSGLSHWLEQDASEMLAGRYQDAPPETETETETEKDTPSGVTSIYVFEAGVIRLTKKNFDQWRDAFSYLDLKSELIALSEWAGKQPKWFPAVAGALNKKNGLAKIATEREKKQPYKWNGIEGVI